MTNTKKNNAKKNTAQADSVHLLILLDISIPHPPQSQSRLYDH